MVGRAEYGGATRTLPEIHSQPDVWRSVAGVLPDARALGGVFDTPPDVVVFTGCGSSYYLAHSAAAVFQRIVGVQSVAIPSSEVVLFPELALRAGERTLLVVFSRSGETTEAVEAARVAQQHGATVLGIGCNPDASMVAACNVNIVLPAAREESVVMTRSFTTMLLAIQRCAGLVAGDTAFLAELASLPDRAAGLDAGSVATIRAIADDRAWESIVFLGAGPLYGVASEASMKLTEMSLTLANVYRPLEFRHGPMSLVDDRTLVVLLASEAGRAHEAAVLRDIRPYGGRALVVAADTTGFAADWCVPVDAGVGDYARAALYLPALQSLGCYRALAKGMNPDEPRHLNRFVALDWRETAPQASA